MKSLYLHSLYSSSDIEVSYNGYKDLKLLSLEFTCTHFYPQMEKFVCSVRIASLSTPPFFCLEHLVVLHKLQNGYQFTIKVTDSNFIILYRYTATCFNQLRGHSRNVQIYKNIDTRVVIATSIMGQTDISV